MLYLYLVSMAIERIETAPAGMNDLDLRALRSAKNWPKSIQSTHSQIITWLPLPSQVALPQQLQHKEFLDFLKPGNSNVHKGCQVATFSSCLWSQRHTCKGHHFKVRLSYIICSECCQASKCNSRKERWHRPGQCQRSSSFPINGQKQKWYQGQESGPPFLHESHEATCGH